MKISIHYSFGLSSCFCFRIIPGIVFVSGGPGLTKPVICLPAFCLSKSEKLNVTAVGWKSILKSRRVEGLILYLPASRRMFDIIPFPLRGRPLPETLLYKFNFLIIIFNILPVFPLDGYKATEVLLAQIINKPFTEQKALFFISNLALAGLIYFFLKSKSFAFLVLFIYLFYRNITHHARNRQIALKKLVCRYQKNRILMEKGNFG